MATSYNPMAIALKQPSKGTMPYVMGMYGNPLAPGAQNTNMPQPGGSHVLSGYQPPAPQQQNVGPEAVRATGMGPYDPAYRQNLATYAMGQFMRPGTNFGFNPTQPLQFGQPTGGGNAPVLGMPQTLLGQALGGQEVNMPTQQPQAASPQGGGNFGNLQSWLEQYMRGFQLPGVGGTSGL
jgi:hypothetical protein